MDAHEAAYYRNRNRIIAFHRSIRVLSSSVLALYVYDVPGVPAPILGGDGGGMRELARVLILRGGLPWPWIAVLNFPLPFTLQARTWPGRRRREPPPIALPIASAAAPPSRFVSLSACTIIMFIISPSAQCLFQAVTLVTLLFPLAKALVPMLQQPELRGAVCRMYLHIQWLLLLPRSRGAAFGFGGEDWTGGGTCPAAAPRLLAFWFQIVLGGVAPLAVAYFVEVRAKERFLDLRRPRREGGSRTSVLGRALLFFGVALLGATLVTGMAAQVPQQYYILFGRRGRAAMAAAKPVSS